MRERKNTNTDLFCVTVIVLIGEQANLCVLPDLPLISLPSHTSNKP